MAMRDSISVRVTLHVFASLSVHSTVAASTVALGTQKVSFARTRTASAFQSLWSENDLHETHYS